MGEVRRGFLVGLLLAVGMGAPARAGVTLTTSRSQLLFSSDPNPDCSKLFKITDDGALPFNVARLRAAVDGAPAGTLGYHWSVKGAAGIVAADLDLGPQDQSPAINGMCGTFGNACILTTDRLRFYNEPSILFVAPTCDALPNDTTRAFRGAVAQVGLKVTAGKRKVGRTTATLAYGQTGAVTLFVDGDDGLGKRSGVGTGVDPFFGATVAGAGLPGAVKSFEFNNGGGGSIEVPPACFTNVGGHRFDGCTGDLVYNSSGTFVASVEAKFDDGSGLCDKATVRVLSCSADPRVDVFATPRLPIYDPDEPTRSSVALRVRLRNASHATGNLPPCAFLLRGAGILTCSAALKVGGTSDTRTTTFDLPHCSATSTQGCARTEDCRPPFCPDCSADETCLGRSHCSKSVSQACGGDVDCDPAVCPSCAADEKCVRVLDLLGGASAVVVRPGESLDLLSETVTLKNEFSDTARFSDTWTVTTVNAGSADRTVKYRIRGRPSPGLRR